MEQGKAPTPAQIAGDARMERVTAAILSGAPRFSAADVYDGLARLAELAARARIEFTRIDFLLVPSALHHYLVSGTGLALKGWVVEMQEMYMFGCLAQLWPMHKSTSRVWKRTEVY